MQSNDKRLNALRDAARVWDECVSLKNKERLVLAADIYEHGLFTRTQLAQIVRLPANTIYRNFAGQDTAIAGRFTPEALSLLAQLRENQIKKIGFKNVLLHAAVDAGCSVGLISRLVGTNYPITFYRNKDRA